MTENMKVKAIRKMKYRIANALEKRSIRYFSRLELRNLVLKTIESFPFWQIEEAYIYWAMKEGSNYG